MIVFIIVFIKSIDCDGEPHITDKITTVMLFESSKAEGDWRDDLTWPEYIFGEDTM